MPSIRTRWLVMNEKAIQVSDFREGLKGQQAIQVVAADGIRTAERR